MVCPGQPLLVIQVIARIFLSQTRVCWECSQPPSTASPPACAMEWFCGLAVSCLCCPACGLCC